MIIISAGSEFWYDDGVLIDDYKYHYEIPKPLEIFCRKKYKGYYLRGQICQFPYPSSDHSEKLSYYQFQLLVLVRGTHEDIYAPVSLLSLRDHFGILYRVGKKQVFKTVGPVKKDAERRLAEVMRNLYWHSKRAMIGREDEPL